TFLPFFHDAFRVEASRRKYSRPSLRRRDVRPVFHLHAGYELVAAVLRAEHAGLAFFDVEPVLAERIDDVRLVRDHDRVGAGRRRDGKQVANGVDAGVVLVRRDHEAALGDVGGLLDILEAGDDRRLVSAVVFAGEHLADRNAGPTDGIAEFFGQGLAF